MTHKELKKMTLAAEQEDLHTRLAKAEEVLRVIIEAEPDCIMLADPSGYLVEMSAPGLAMLEASSLQDVQDRSLSAFICPEHKAAFEALHKTVMLGGNGTLEFEVTGLKGTRRWLDTSAAPLRDAQGQVSMLLGITRDITERKKAEEILAERARALRLDADIAAMWTENEVVPAVLNRCAEAIVIHLDAAFARIWTLNREEYVLELQASAGMYTHLNGPHGRMPVGKFKIGLIAEEGKPHLTNRVIGDPGVGDQEWARREGLVSFAGYPLIMDGRVLGVMAMFARRPLSEFTLDALASVAEKIAIGLDRKRAEEALRESEARFRSLFENVAIGLYRTTPDGRILMANPALMQMLGYASIEEMQRRDLEKEGFEPGYSRELFKERLEKEGLIIGLEAAWTKSDGTRLWLRESARAVRDEAGKVLYYEGTAEDTSERKRTEEALQARDAYLTAIIENQPGLTWLKDMEGRFLATNHAFALSCGRQTPEDVVGKTDFDVWPGGLAEKYRADDARVMQTGRSIMLEELVYDRGEAKWFETFKAPVRDVHGNVIGTTGFARDITDRKRAEDQMKKLFTAVEQAPDTIVITDLNGRIEYVNPAFEKLTGYSKAEAIGQTPALVKSGEHGIEFYQQMWRSILSGREFRAEFINKKKNGEIYNHEATIAPVKDSNGEITHFVSSGRDVTWKKQAEERLMRFTTIIEATSDFVAIVDPQGRILYINSAGRKMLGLPLGDDLSTVSIDDSHPQWAANLVLNEGIPAAIRDGSWLGETVFLSRDGREIPVSQLILSHKDALGNVAFVSTIARDISEIRRAEEALRTSEEKYRELFEESKDTIFISSADGTLLDINRAGVEMFGYSDKSEILNLDITQNLFVHPEDRKRYRQTLESDGFVQDYELFMKRKDGRKIWVLETSTAVRDKDGTVVAYRGINRDVTHIRLLQEQLLHSQKMETIGRLAGGVAHDFNNILMAVGSYCELMMMGLTQNDPLCKHIQQILKAERQGASLTRQLLAFSRKQILEPKVFDPGAVVSSMENLLQRLIGEDINLRILTRPEGGMVEADPNQMEQVIMNLAVNSRDAMPRGGRLTIEVSNEELDEEYARLHLDARPGPYVTLSITDTGHGMDPETVSHIFEPFFTTKSADKGTGLGLATVYGIVTQSHGSISVYSEPGQGTTFRIYLPRIGGVGKSVVLEQASVVLTGGSETILLVDDNESIRLAVGELMKMKGYNVLLAGDGKEALEISRNHAGPIDLLVTDVVMPEMSGRELAQQVSAERARIKVLYMSGYTDDAVVRHGILSAESAFLQKPAPMTTLLSKIRKLLSS
jgi:PAS domain S-box-containing protein